LAGQQSVRLRKSCDDLQCWHRRPGRGFRPARPEQQTPAKLSPKQRDGQARMRDQQRQGGAPGNLVEEELHHLKVVGPSGFRWVGTQLSYKISDSLTRQVTLLQVTLL
jgi:hypothetical protein